MKGLYMPFQPTPRSLRDEAALDLEVDMLGELRAVADELAHVMRRIARINQQRHRSTGFLRDAQSLEDSPWDGVERRRPNRVAQMEAAATIADRLRGTGVAA